MMEIHERVKGFICTTAHPQGCKLNVLDQLAQVRAAPQAWPQRFNRILIIGGSTGYGLASRVVAGAALRAATLNVALERAPRVGRTASAGWYQTAALETELRRQGTYAATLNADAFSAETKAACCKIIAKQLGQVDLLIYSVAAPKRKDPVTGTTYTSVLKPLGALLRSKTVHVAKRILQDVEIQPATTDELAATIKVMGGEDWQLWVDALLASGVAARGFKTLAYSYIGSDLTAAIYRKGTIGRAKEHLEATAARLQTRLAALPEIEGAAGIAVNKALVTQASAAIPILPLYLAILIKVMREQGLHEGTTEQMQRLFAQLGAAERTTKPFPTQLRLDDHELSPAVQKEVLSRWQRVTPETLATFADLDSYWKEFLNLFGFARQDVDYSQPVNEMVPLELPEA